ncbi:MAG: hypothetical protein K2X50_10420, partial [Gammaproteobacteria bacterium]|nr:hypothetical protein [Gammaproteobacteria bacterium]
PFLLCARPWVVSPVVYLKIFFKLPTGTHDPFLPICLTSLGNSVYSSLSPLNKHFSIWLPIRGNDDVLSR